MWKYSTLCNRQYCIQVAVFLSQGGGCTPDFGRRGWTRKLDWFQIFDLRNFGDRQIGHSSLSGLGGGGGNAWLKYGFLGVSKTIWSFCVSRPCRTANKVQPVMSFNDSWKFLRPEKSHVIFQGWNFFLVQGIFRILLETLGIFLSGGGGGGSDFYQSNNQTINFI